MREDEERGGADEPEERGERGREPEHREPDDEERGVERLLGDELVAHLHRLGGWRGGRV